MRSHLLISLAGLVALSSGCAVARATDDAVDEDPRTAEGALDAAERTGAAHDLMMGENLYLQQLVGQLDSEARVIGTGGLEVGKAAGSLSFVINPRRMLGIDLDLDIRVDGQILPSGDIRLTADRSPSYYNARTGLTVTRVRVDVTLRPDYTPGAQSPDCIVGFACRHNVTALSLPGGTIVVDGRQEAIVGVGLTDIPFMGRVYRVAPRGLAVVGGLPRARLGRLTLPTQSFCQSSSPQRVHGIAVLDGPSPAGGTVVTMHSGLGTSARAVIAGGTWSGDLFTTIPADYAGAFDVEAAAGGRVLQGRIVVRSRAACASRRSSDGPLFDAPLRARELVIGVGECLQCGVDFNTLGDAVITLAGNATLHSKRWGATDLSSLLSGLKVSRARLNDRGDALLVGADASGNARSMIVTRVGEKGELVSTAASDFVGVVLSNEGTALGASTKGLPAAFYGKTMVDLSTLTESAGTVVGVDHFGVLAINGLGAVSLVDARSKNAPKQLDEGTVATATSSRGDVVGFAPRKGIESAFVYDADTRALTYLGPLPGFETSRAVAVNAMGWAVGTSAYGKSKASFLYTPKEGLTDLQSLVDPKSNLVITEVLGINDLGEIAVRATLAGKPGLFVLS